MKNNGLNDGISVIEKDNRTIHSQVDERDMLYTKDLKSFENFQDISQEEGYTLREYDPEEFCKPITLLNIEDAKIDLSCISEL